MFRIAIRATLATLVAAGCSDATPPDGVSEGVRVINAYPQPVDVLVDGNVVVSGLAAGQLDSLAISGLHTVTLRASGTATAAAVSMDVGAGEMLTVAAVRVGASIAASALDDTNAIVPAGFTKVRVLHLAPNAGQIEVGRTQPDFNVTPAIGWKIPFLYDSLAMDPLANPYFQSTVGAWDVRVWRTPSEDALGWNGTTAVATFTLASGEKRTVLVLDKPGGGIQLRVID